MEMDMDEQIYSRFFYIIWVNKNEGVWDFKSITHLVDLEIMFPKNP